MGRPPKEKKEEVSKALSDAIANIEKQFGKGIVNQLGDTSSLEIGRIPSGSIKLDNALGGGFPRGRIVEIYGPESSGKTTLCLSVITEVQRLGGKAVFIDAEHSLDLDWAKKNGVDTDTLYICQPDYGEQALTVLETFVDTNEIDVIVIDSVASLVPKVELEGEAGQSHMGLQARMMSQAMRRLTAKIGNTKTVVIFLNQIRMKIGVMFGNPETTTGGNALKFYSSIRIDVRRKEVIKNGDNILANLMKAKIVKNKTATPYKEAEFEIYFDDGLSRLSDVINLAVESNIIEKSGSWFSYKEEKVGQGAEQLRTRLKEDTKLFDQIRKDVLDMLEATK